MLQPRNASPTLIQYRRRMMEQIKIKQIKKDESNENLSTSQSYLVLELFTKPSPEWNEAFDQNAVSAKTKTFETALCDNSLIYIKYKKSAKRDEVFNQIEALVNETNQEQNDFNSWIDKTNIRLAGQ
jgi:hypothetical protein